MSVKKGNKIMNSTIDRKRIFIFVGIAYGLSVAVYLVVFMRGRESGSYSNLLAGRILLMFAPLIAAIATRLMTREGWSNILLRPDFTRGRWRYYLAAWFLPPVATLVGAAIYYLLSPGHFDPAMTSYRELAGSPAGGATGPWGFFITQVGIGILVTPLSVTLLLSFGEEFGWRAYLLPKLVPLGPRKAALLVGVVHGVWHWPSI
ncbi:MAG: CPBP family intramembrane metalloprotease, partial [Anaerolineaceae bacterium]